MIHKDPSQALFEEKTTPTVKHGTLPSCKPTISDRFFANFNYNERKKMNSDITAMSGGSMTQLSFYNYCEHFCKNLPKGQGKGGDAVILFLDGHASPWTVAAL